jgi:hypothetical protein
MQDPNTVDPEGQAGGPPPGPATDMTNTPAAPTPAIVEPEPPEAGGEAMAVEPPHAQEQVTDEPAATAPATPEEAAAKTEEAPARNEEAAEPAAAAVAVAEPEATIVEQTRGVWTDEQVEAFRNRLRETTADIVDRAAGAVIETINVVAAAIRSRTSSDRPR